MFIFLLPAIKLERWHEWWEKRSHKGGWQGEALSALECNILVLPWEEEEKLSLTEHLGRKEAFHLCAPALPWAWASAEGVGGLEWVDLLLTVSDPFPAVSLPPQVHPLGQKKMPWTMISFFVLWSVSDFFFNFLEKRISTCLTYTPRGCRSREPGSGFPVDSFLLSQEPQMPLCPWSGFSSQHSGGLGSSLCLAS